MSAFFEPAVAADRLKLLHEKVVRTPVLLRNIRHGHQIVSWMQAIEPAEGSAGGAQFLVVTRRQPGDVAGTLLVEGEYQLEESRFVHLGPLDVLTPRELEVLALLGQGLSVKEIARLLHRSEKTVETHRAAIGRKLKVDDRVALAEIARRAGISVADAERTRV
jgi:DNA-binding CsgD family transcriptional regulator